jgi:hypothetical protein
MSIAAQLSAAQEAVADHEQKRLALGYLQEAWVHARHEGIDGDCLAQTALFLALVELISTYGEDATARYAESLAARIHNGEFSVELSRQ